MCRSIPGKYVVSVRKELYLIVEQIMVRCKSVKKKQSDPVSNKFFRNPIMNITV